MVDVSGVLDKLAGAILNLSEGLEILASTATQSSPWDDVAEMAPWWVQNHRLTCTTGKGAWLCTCGAKGRDGASEAALVLYNKHINRVKKKGSEHDYLYRTPNHRLPSYPYIKIPPRNHSALGSLFVQTRSPVSA